MTDEATGNPVLDAGGSRIGPTGSGRNQDHRAARGDLLQQPRLWHFDHPNLYRLTAELAGGHSLDTTFGIRKIEIRDGAFYLNGERVRLMGVERMAGSNPEYGMAEPAEWIDHDHADMKELNCVYTRVHWPQDRAVLDWCDRHGMLIQTEVPTWGTGTFRGMTAEPAAGHHEQRPGTTSGNDRPRPQPPLASSRGACATRSAARIRRLTRSPGACTRNPRGSIPSGW